MELIICVLIIIIILLVFKTHNLSKDAKKEQQEYQARISSLEQANADLQEQTNKFFQEISGLKDALAESERELSFYKNIGPASGELNVPSSTDHDDNAQLDSEQADIFHEMEYSNKNYFITGKAGTGKSFLLNAFKKRTQKSYIVLAPTGIAALNVDGVTLHSAFGYRNLVNLDVDSISPWTIRLKSEKQLVLKNVSTIIIDEISMVRSDTFEKIDRILKVINRTDKPFGGKQILLFGDLFQLPPIVNKPEHDFLMDYFGGIHFFCSHAYKQSNFNFRELTINHRQEKDAAFFEILNRIRDGSVTSDDIKALNERVVQDFSVYDRFTTLLPTKAEVEKLNQFRISQLKTDERAYCAKIITDKYPNQTRKLDEIFPIADTLRLKKGVLVMMVANDPEHRWVNGTLGIIEALSSKRILVSINKRTYDIEPFEFSAQEVTYENGKLVYEDILTVMQYPIVPAYAITIHKSQGQTYKNIICNINRCFADGQAYVALSRCASLNGLHLTDKVSPASIRVDKNVLDFYHRSLSQNS